MENTIEEAIVISDDEVETDENVGEIVRSPPVMITPIANKEEPAVVTASASQAAVVAKTERKPKYIDPEKFYADLCFHNEKIVIKTLAEYRAHFEKWHIHEGTFHCYHCKPTHHIRRPDRLEPPATSIDAAYLENVLKHLNTHKNNRCVCAQDGCNMCEEDEMGIILHSIDCHKDKEITYENIRCFNENDWETETILCRFSCNLCSKRCRTVDDFESHFYKEHKRRVIDGRIAIKTIRCESNNPTEPNQSYRQTPFYYRAKHECACDLKCKFQSFSRAEIFKRHLLTAKEVPGHDDCPLEFQLTEPTIYRLDSQEANILTLENKRFDFNYVYACLDQACKRLYFESADAVRKHFFNCHKDLPKFRFTIKYLVLRNGKHFGTFELIHKYFAPHKRETLLARCGACNPETYNVGVDPIAQLTDEELKYYSGVDLLTDPTANNFEFRLSQTASCGQDHVQRNYAEMSNHVSRCQIKCNTKSGLMRNITSIKQKLAHTDVSFTNGFVVNFKCLLDTTFGETILEQLRQDRLRNNVIFSGIDIALLQKFNSTAIFEKIADKIGFRLKNIEYTARPTDGEAYLIVEFGKLRMKNIFKKIWQQQADPLMVSHVFGCVTSDEQIIAKDHLTSCITKLSRKANKAHMDGKVFAVWFDGYLKVQKTKDSAPVTIFNEKRLTELIDGEWTNQMEQQGTSSGRKRRASEQTDDKTKIKALKIKI